MPKSTKHKKARVADFAKAKLKLGKGKQIANNATNTTISSRSLALPTQLASVAPTSAPTSRRNLPLPVLLSQTTHHAPALRLLALTEARQLIKDHPHLVKAHAPALLRALGGLQSDPSAKVRRMTRECLEDVLRRLGGSGADDDDEEEGAMTIEQGSPLEEIGLTTIVYTLSALSSLEEDVRIDALESLSMLVRVMPRIVAGGWKDGHGEGSKVLEALLGVMRIRALVPSAGTSSSGFTSSANADLSPSARLATLKTLSLFLQSSLSFSTTTDDDDEPWYLLPSFATPRAYYTFLSSLSLHSPAHQPLSKINTTGYLVEPFSLATRPPLPFPTFATVSATASASSTPSATSLNSYRLLKTIHPTLLSTFLDSAPIAFSPSPNPGTTTSLDTVLKLMEIAKALFWDLLGGVREVETEDTDDVREMLWAILSHMVKYFPFGADELVARGAEVDQIHQTLSLLYSSLVALLVLSEPESLATRKKGLKKLEKEERKKEKLVVMVDGVGEWVGKALRGELTTPTSPIATPFPASSFLLLEPTLWALLNSADEAISSSILDSVITNFSTATGERKKVAFEWLARALLISNQPTYVNRFAVDLEQTGPKGGVGKWIVSLPRYLWELGKKDEEGTEMVLTLLLKLAQQGHLSSQSLLPASTFSSLAPSLTPFFHLQHPSRGALPGPFCKLSLRLQELSLDFARYLLQSISADEGRALVEAVDRALSVASCSYVRHRWSRNEE